MVGNPCIISESAVDFCLLFTNPAGATRSSLMMARMVALHRALRCLAVPAVPPRMLLMLLMLLPSPATAASPTWSQQMVGGTQQVCFPAVVGDSALAQPVCVDRLALGTTARNAGHFCGGHFAARLPAAAFCTGGGCPIEADALRSQDGHVVNANLLSEAVLPLLPYGESWVYGCALRSYDSPVHACGKAGQEQQIHDELAKQRLLLRHVGKKVCGCAPLTRNAKANEEILVMVLFDVAFQIAVSREYGGLGLLAAFDGEELQIRPTVQVSQAASDALKGLLPSSASGATRDALRLFQTTVSGASGVGMRPLVATDGHSSSVSSSVRAQSSLHASVL